MRRACLRYLLVWIACIFVFAACGGGEDGGGELGGLEDFSEEELIALGPCGDGNEDKPELCGAPCVEDEAFPDGLCDDGFYCRTEGEQAGTCSAQCDPNDLETWPCPGDAYCTAYGECISLSEFQDVGDVCDKDVVQGKRQTATIHLLVDASSSIGRELEDKTDGDDPSRWNVMLDILAGTGEQEGLLEEFDGLVRFGMTTFTSIVDKSTVPRLPIGDGYRCLAVNQNIPPSDFGQAADVIAGLNAMPEEGIGGTPTAELVKMLLDNVESGELEYNPNDPVYFLLLTDGAPRWCTDDNADNYSNFNSLPNGIRSNQTAKVFLTDNPGLNYLSEQVSRARDDFNIETFVIGLGVGNSEGQARLEKLYDDGKANNDLDELRKGDIFNPTNFSEYVSYDLSAEALNDTDKLYSELVPQTPGYEEALDRIAAAGSSPSAPQKHYAAIDESSFRTAVQTIVGDTISCELRFGSKAEIPRDRVEDVCGTVKVLFDGDGDGEGEELPCSSDGSGNEGWTLSSSRTKVVLLPATCEAYKRDPSRLKDIDLGCNFAILE